MKIEYGKTPSEYGPGVLIKISGDEVAHAIRAWIESEGVVIEGPSTVMVNGGYCRYGQVFVDPSGDVTANGERFSGRGVGEPDIAFIRRVHSLLSSRERSALAISLGEENLAYRGSLNSEVRPWPETVRLAKRILAERAQ